MNTSFASAMGRALEETRAGNAEGATQIIKDALSAIAPARGPADEARPPLRLSRVRSPLGRVVDGLAKGKALRARLPKGRATGKPNVPEGGAYDRRQHVSDHGSVAYTLYVPSKREEPLRGLILMLHGCTQNADDFAAGTQMNLHAERLNMVVAYPEQNRSANQLGCWNWFEPKDQSRGRGEPALLAGLASELAREFSVPDGHTFVAGLSAGGAMAAILGATYGDVFAGVGVHSGLAPGAARDVIGAYSAMNGKGHESVAGKTAVPTIVIHGSADSTVHPANAGKVIASVVGVTASVIDGRSAGAEVALHQDGTGRVVAENWTVPGLAHAWSGGSANGSYTAPGGMDASAEMMRFFLNVAEDGKSAI